MKPIALTMTAFGPFPDRVHLDFSTLGAHKIFLITGPTGSGKTTILDGIVYALYGKTSGGFREGATMRSDYADASVVTKVEYVFAVGQRRYKIERTPKQLVKKKRGEGMREETAKVALSEWREGDWQLVSARGNEVKDRVERIIGFRADQFLQVVLLPQGEFRKLLLAKTSEREELFHTLFQTHIYRALQERLKQRLAHATEGERRHIEEVRMLLQGESVDTEEALRALYEEAQSSECALRGKRNAQKERLDVVKTSYEAWKTYEALVESLERREQIQAELREKELSIAPLRNQLEQWESIQEALRRESRYMTLGEEWRNLDGKCALAEERWRECGASLTEAQEGLSEFERGLDEQRKRQQQIATLESKADEVIRYRRSKEEREAWMEQLAVIGEKRANLEHQLAGVIEKRTDLQDQVVELERVAIQSESAESLNAWWSTWSAECDTFRALLEKADELNTSLAVVASQLEEGRRRLDIAKKQRDVLVDYHRLCLAYTLAADLEDKKPCPVCGSVEHPVKAAVPQHMVTDGELEIAQESVLAEERRVAQIEANYEQLLIQRASLEEDKDAFGVAWAREELQWTDYDAVLSLYGEDRLVLNSRRDAKLSLEDKEAFATLLEERREGMQRFKSWMQESVKKKDIILREQMKTVQDISAYQETLRSLVEEQLQWEAKEESFQTLQSSLEGRLEISLDAYEDVLADLRGEVEAWEALRKSKQDAVKVLLEKQQYEAGVVETLTKEGAVKEAARDEAQRGWIEELERLGLDEVIYGTIRAYETCVGAWKEEVISFETQWKEETVLLEEDKRRLSSYTEVPKEVKVEEMDGESACYDELVSQCGAAELRVTRLRELVERLESMLSKGAEERKKREFIHDLADMANGGATGIRGLTFELFVMGAILEDVLKAANLRLTQMSRGRYELQRDEVENGGRGYRGLDLAVFDAYTGRVRPANTLSGGESFLASLSLAMGLADVIQAYAGGVHLDMMCIDEGFGTLDAEALDVAMETLLELQDHGRLVGIISHVAELKSRILAQLVVQPKERGSTAYFQGM